MSDKPRGRPRKDDEVRFSHYDYVRMTKATWEEVNVIAEHIGLNANGGRAAAIRFAISKVAALLGSSK